MRKGRILTHIPTGKGTARDWFTLEQAKHKIMFPPEDEQMPWKVGKKTAKGYPIIKADTGKVVGFSDTKKKAEASVRARYAHYKGKG